MGYTYNRTAARVPTLNKMVAAWLGKVADLLAKGLPAGLKADGVRVNATDRNFALVEGKGYSRSDFEATTSLSLTIDYQPFRLRVFGEYKDVMMGASRGDEREFTLDADQNPAELVQEVSQWLADR